jgi:CRP-like cAMP-binding protein
MRTNARTLSDVPAINRFLSYCRVRTVPSKTVMIHAGDLPDVLYYIVDGFDGSVEVMIEDEDGNEMVLSYLNKGQFFGEMGLFYEQPTRSAWVRTRTECEIAEMTYPRFRQIASESPGPRGSGRLPAKARVWCSNSQLSSRRASTAPTANSVILPLSTSRVAWRMRSWISATNPTP